MLRLFFFLAMVVVCRAKLPYRGNENHSIYVSPNLDMTNKIHAVVVAQDCRCAKSIQVQKQNLIDYMDSLALVFSFSAYVNAGDGTHPCYLPRTQIEKMTAPVIANIAEPSLTYPAFDEGTVLARAISDFVSAPFIISNSARIFATDKSGGIMLLFGNIELRPCKLFPWFMPWTFSTGQRVRVDFGANSTPDPGFDPDEIALFASIVEQLTRDGVYRTKHQENLRDNTGDVWSVDAFGVRAIFIPHRFVREFHSLLQPFTRTDVSPALYVPFVVESMFDKNEWIFMHPDTHNETLRMGALDLMESCEGKGTVNQRAAKSLYNFGFSACGGVVAEIEHVIVVVEEVTGQSATSLGIALMVLGLMAILGVFFAFKHREIKDLCSVLARKLRCGRRKWNRRDTEFVPLDPISGIIDRVGADDASEDSDAIHFN